jgi:hypothetical protein
MENKQSKIIKRKTTALPKKIPAPTKISAPKKAARSLALPLDKRIQTAEGLKRKQFKPK